jgi:CheY-like chemotaxis protein
MIYIISACIIFIVCVIWLRSSIDNVAQALMRVAKLTDKQFDAVWKHLEKKNQDNNDWLSNNDSHPVGPEYKPRTLDLEDRPFDKNKKTVVYIDDDMFLLDMYGSGLRKNGYNTFLRDVLKKDFVSEIANLKPDLILCDVIRPEPDGIQIIKALKADKRTVNIPFIFLSNSINPEVTEIIKKLGALDPILKAETSKFALVQKVEDILGKTQI